MRVSKNGVVRHGRRAGNIDRLNQSVKAYAPAVLKASKQYDGSNGVQAFVSFGWLKGVDGLLNSDADHSAFIRETEAETLPTFHFHYKRGK